MELTTQLRVLTAISGVGLALTLLVFSSPGWLILITQLNETPGSELVSYSHDKGEVSTTASKLDVRKNVSLADDKHAEDTLSEKSKRIHLQQGKRKQNTERPQDVKNTGWSRSEDVENTDSLRSPTVQKNKTSTLCLHAGLWYFVACVREHTDQHYNTGQSCHVSTYENAGSNIPHLPSKMCWLKRIYEKIRETSKMGLMEFRFEAILGLGFSIIGFGAMACYKQSLGERRGSGIVACLSLFLSGGMIWTAVGKVATSIAQIQILFGNDLLEPFKVPAPWCLIVGAVSATFTLAAAIGLVFVLSRDRKTFSHVDNETYYVKNSLPYRSLE